jgi:hypothetical protein
MGSLHPRLKEPVGRRLATALVALHYGGNGTVTGPTVAGCTVGQTSHNIVVRFNRTLLKGDAVAITRVQTPIPYTPTPPPSPPSPPVHTNVTDAKPPPSPPGPIEPVADSSLMHVCTGDVADCGCLSWRSLKKTRLVTHDLTSNGFPTQFSPPPTFVRELCARSRGVSMGNVQAKIKGLTFLFFLADLVAGFVAIWH